MQTIELFDIEVVGIALIAITAAAVIAPRSTAAVVVVAGFCLSEPTVFGVQTKLIGVALIIAGSLPVLILGLGDSKYTWRTWLPIGILLAATAWIAFREFLVPGSGVRSTVFFATFALPGVVFCAALTDQRFADKTRRILCGVLVFVAGLTATTLVLGLVVGFATLRMGELPFGYADALSNYVLFPGSFLFGHGQGTEIPRFLGIGREAGVGGALFGWAYFATPDDWRLRNLARALLVIGLFATQSTAAIGMVAAISLVRVALNLRPGEPAKQIVVVCLALACGWLALSENNFGLLAKAETASYQTRTEMTMNGIHQALSHPLTTSSIESNSAINLIASVALMGLPWSVLMIVLLLLPCVGAHRNDWQLYAGSLVLVTVTFSQPLAGAPGFLFLSLVTLATLGGTTRENVSEPAPPAQSSWWRQGLTRRPQSSDPTPT